MDPQKLIIFGIPVRTAGCASFDLSCPTGNCQICDKGILCFPGPVRDHCTIPGMLSHLHRIQSFRESSDLVYLNKDSIGNIKPDAAVQPFDIGDKQIVAYQLDLFPRCSVRYFQPSQSSSQRPSSMETMGNFSTSFS